MGEWFKKFKDKKAATNAILEMINGAQDGALESILEGYEVGYYLAAKEFYETNGIVKDFKKAIKFLEEVSELGQGTSRFTLLKNDDNIVWTSRNLFGKAMGTFLGVIDNGLISSNFDKKFEVEILSLTEKFRDILVALTSPDGVRLGMRTIRNRILVIAKKNQHRKELLTKISALFF